MVLGQARYSATLFLLGRTGVPAAEDLRLVVPLYGRYLEGGWAMWFKPSFKIPAVAAISFCLVGGTVPAVADTLHVPSEFATIQAAIDAAKGGDLILVAPGTYGEAINLLGKAIELRSELGSVVTVIDGKSLGSSVITCVSGESADTVIDGFTIRGGTGTFLDPPFEGFSGGGMLNIDSSPAVQNCHFSDNSATRGGAMANIASSPIVSMCVFDENTALSRGGAIYNAGANGTDSNPMFSECMFANNASAVIGGAMFNTGVDGNVGNPILIACTFVRNHSADRGGAVYANGGNADYVNCVFDANASGIHGGGIYNLGASPTVTDCLFVNNDALGHGGGIINTNFSETMIIGTSFLSNTSGMNGAAIANGAVASTLIDTCTFELNTAQGVGGGVYGSGPSTIRDSSFCENVPDHINGNWVDDGGNSFFAFCCLGDLNGDNIVGAGDLLILLGFWGQCAPVCLGDLDGDGIVGASDLLILLANWGPCP